MLKIIVKKFDFGETVLNTLHIYIYIKWATTKQACSDELVVYLFFSPIYIYIYIWYLLSNLIC